MGDAIGDETARDPTQGRPLPKLKPTATPATSRPSTVAATAACG
jgi:hypothetical protein